MKSHIREFTVKGTTKFELSINHPAVGGVRKRERLWFNTRKEAETAQESVELQYAQGGVIWGRLKPHEQADIMVCMEELRQLGTTVRGATEFYKANSGSTKHRTMTLIEMVNLTIQTKTTSRRRTRYVNQLKYTLERFARGRQQMPLSQVTPAMITDFLASQKGRGGGMASGDTILGVITRLRTMFSLACKGNTYLEAGANPMIHVELPYIDSKVPVILTPEDAGKLLWVCRVTDRQFLPYLVLGLFGGIRPEELEKLRWRDIHLDDGEIVIEEGVSKTRSRRCFDITFDQKQPIVTLKEWLYQCMLTVLNEHDPLTVPDRYIFECEVEGNRLGQSKEAEKVLRNVRQCIRRHRKSLCKRAGVKWHQDILRKTCASVWMAKYENETKVAAMLGNSPKIIHKHYRGLLRRKDADKFETLTPANVRNDPIELPKGGAGKKAGVLIEEKSQ